MPPIAVVDYSAIDSGLGGPPYPVSVVGVDRLANWSALDSAAYDEKRKLWRAAIIAAIDRVFPGFADKVVASVFSTASTMNSYLNAPEGAVYGFAPLPPTGSFWQGSRAVAQDAGRGALSRLLLCRQRRLYGRDPGGRGRRPAGPAAAGCRRLAKNRQVPCYAAAHEGAAANGRTAMDAMTDLRGKLHHSWGWLLALGVVLILFGGLILTTPLGVITATLTTEIWIAAALVVAGVLQLAHGLKTTGWSGRLWQMVGGVVFIIGGLLDVRLSDLRASSL